MSNLTQADIAYRLYRLRRLIVASIVPPFIAMALVGLTGLGIGLDWSGILLLILWTAATLYLAVRFPNGWTDIAAVSASLTIAVLLSPVMVIIGVGPIFGTILLALFLVIGWFMGQTLIPELLSEPMGEIESTFRKRVRLDPEKLMLATFLRPDAEVGLHTCGPENADGIFPVTANGYDMGEGEFSIGETEALQGGVSFWAKVVERDDTRQVTQIFTDADSPSSGMEEQIITPARGGAHYEKREVHSHFDKFAALGFWLSDFEADHFQALIDHVEGRQPRAIKHATHDTLLIAVARRMTQRMADSASAP